MNKEQMQAFIDLIAPLCQKYAKQYGFKSCAGAVGQAILESSFGSSYKAGFNNFFGLKYRENRVNCNNGYFLDGGSEQNPDGSYTNLNPIKTKWFRFDTVEAGVEGYYQFINISNYKEVKKQTNSLYYLQEIKKAGYATSINYVENVYRVVKEWNLDKYDSVFSVNEPIIIKPEDTVSRYSNSPLVSYTNLTTHHSGERTHKIDTITIHCIVGQWSAKQGCDYFKNTDRQASCNYIVGKDGDIGLCVEEKNRSWCSSNKENDQRAITIETASDTTHPYAITDKALNSLILLCADICKRNGIPALKFSYDKNERVNHLNGVNMTCHRDFAKKSCPGDYIYNKEEYIASEVNKLLGLNVPIVQPKEEIQTKEKNKFNYIKYSDDYADLKKAFGYDKEKLWTHYLTYGKKEGRKVYFDLEVKDGYLVQVSISDLNIRESHTVNSRSKGYIKPGIYTIVEENNGFGKLKSGTGWISLKYCKKL